LRGLIPCRGEVGDTGVGNGVHGLRNGPILKKRLRKVENVVNRDVSPSIGEVDDALGEVGSSTECGVEREVGPRRHVVDELHHRPPLIDSGNILQYFDPIFRRKVSALDVPRGRVGRVVGVGKHADLHAGPVDAQTIADIVRVHGRISLTDYLAGKRRLRRNRGRSGGFTGCRALHPSTQARTRGLAFYFCVRHPRALQGRCGRELRNSLNGDRPRYEIFVPGNPLRPHLLHVLLQGGPRLARSGINDDHFSPHGRDVPVYVGLRTQLAVSGGGRSRLGRRLRDGFRLEGVGPGLQKLLVLPVEKRQFQPDARQRSVLSGQVLSMYVGPGLLEEIRVHPVELLSNCFRRPHAPSHQKHHQCAHCN